MNLNLNQGAEVHVSGVKQVHMIMTAEEKAQVSAFKARVLIVIIVVIVIVILDQMSCYDCYYYDYYHKNDYDSYEYYY